MKKPVMPIFLAMIILFSALPLASAHCPLCTMAAAAGAGLMGGLAARGFRKGKGLARKISRKSSYFNRLFCCSADYSFFNLFC